jgi:hypothetical protein
MRESFLDSMMTVAVAAATVGAIISMSVTRTSAQAPATSAAAPAPAPKTPWGDPDLQGIWLDETDTPLQRPAKYAGQEFSSREFTSWSFVAAQNPWRSRGRFSKKNR